VNRAEKTENVEQIRETLQQYPHVILASFRGLTVNQANELRRRIGGAGGRYRVVKNRLAKRAAAGTHAERLTEVFAGPCAVVTHDSDPISLAKALTDFAKDNPQLELLAGIIDAKELLDSAGVKRLAKMPGQNELRAQLLALIQTPASSLARLLGTPGSQIARVMDARREELGGEPEG
jgi:large subunit ribosomal protein L10